MVADARGGRRRFTKVTAGAEGALAEGMRTSDLRPAVPPAPGHPVRIGWPLPEAVAALRPGAAALLDDGAVAAVVAAVAPGEAEAARDPHSPRRSPARRGDLPDTELPLTADEEVLLPSSPSTPTSWRCRSSGPRPTSTTCSTGSRAAKADHLGLVLRIATRQAFENLPSTLLAGMRHPRLAVMIAPGPAVT